MLMRIDKRLQDKMAIENVKKPLQLARTAPINRFRI